MIMRKVLPYRFSVPVILLLVIIAGFYPSCTLNDQWDEYFSNSPGRVEDNVLDLISREGNFSLFHDKLVQYGFDEILTKDQYFTVFVPVNSAFEGLPEYSDSEWQKILRFHILYSRLFSTDFGDRDLLTTAGKYLKLRHAGENGYTIFESAVNMDRVDNYCSNGVIHEINRLMIPKPNVYEYIMDLDSTYSILQDFLNSMNARFIDYGKSQRIGVDDNGNAIYDTVWREENYFLDKIAGLNNEALSYTGFIPSNADVRSALHNVSEYFGNVDELDEEAYHQLLFITFSGNFTKDAYTYEELPGTVLSVTGKTIDKSTLNFDRTNLQVSNGVIHLLSGMTIPKSYFLLPITIECDRKENRKVSNTIYPIEQQGDTRATNGSYVYYGCNFVGDYIEFTVNMVLKTTYWIVWTGPKQGPSHYRISVRDKTDDPYVWVGDPVNNWTKGNFVPVVSGTFTFSEFGSKTVRMTIVDELPLVGYNSIYLDYIKLVPDEIYQK